MIFNKKVLISVNILILFSFFLGYLIGENSAGGGPGDYNHIKLNYDLIFQNDIKDINWRLYDSSRYPFLYFLTKIYLPLDYNIIKLNNFILSILTPIIIFFVIFYKNQFFKSEKNILIIFTISSLFYLSPYFRTSAFWMLEENFGILFLSISTFFFYLSLNSKKKNFIFIFLNLLFIYFSFFSSQNLFIFVIANYFFYIIFFWGQKVKIFYITLLNIIFLISPYLVFENIFFEISRNVSNARLSFNYFNIVDIFSILLIYIFPIYLLNFKFDEIISSFKKNYIFLAIMYGFFVFIFFNYDPAFIGGGAIKKLLIFIFGNHLFYKIFLISFSFMGFILYLQLSICKETKLLLFIPYFILLTFVDCVYQEYLDPIFLIFVLFYTNLLHFKNVSSLYKFITYFFILLISANIYYLKYAFVPT